MRTTGIIRRIDNLGRIVIPRECRKKIFGTTEKSEGMPMEIFMDKDDIILRKYEENKTDDVCEWIKYDYRTICPKNHDANNPYWRIPDNMDKLKYCPYCGKKIKIVGD